MQNNDIFRDAQEVEGAEAAAHAAHPQLDPGLPNADSFNDGEL